MAHFRGTVQGNHSEASRLGHKTTGLIVEAQSWQGKITARLWHDPKTDLDMVVIRQKPHYGTGQERLLYQGPIGEDNPPSGHTKA